MRTITDSDRKAMLFRFDEELSSKLKYLAKQQGRSVNAFVEEILTRELQSREGLSGIILPTGIDSDIKAFCGILRGRNLSDSALEEDRYQYLLNK